ncbi:WXG100 family type VII secretion target, partial [Rugosimonospora acidiphila]
MADVLPDPAKLRDLAAKWQAMADALYSLQATVQGAVLHTNWTGDAHLSAVATGFAVSKPIQTAADNAQTFAQQINEFADKVQKEIDAQNAADWATIIGVIIGAASFGLGSLLSWAIETLGALIASVVAALGASLDFASAIGEFVASAIVFGALGSGIDIGSQLAGEAIAHTNFHIDPLSAGLAAGFGALGGGLFAGKVIPGEGDFGAGGPGRPPLEDGLPHPDGVPNVKSLPAPNGTGRVNVPALNGPQSGRPLPDETVNTPLSVVRTPNTVTDVPETAPGQGVGRIADPDLPNSLNANARPNPNSVDSVNNLSTTPRPVSETPNAVPQGNGRINVPDQPATVNSRPLPGDEGPGRPGTPPEVSQVSARPDPTGSGSQPVPRPSSVEPVRSEPSGPGGGGERVVRPDNPSTVTARPGVNGDGGSTVSRPPSVEPQRSNSFGSGDSGNRVVSPGDSSTV